MVLVFALSESVTRIGNVPLVVGVNLKSTVPVPALYETLVALTVPSVIEMTFAADKVTVLPATSEIEQDVLTPMNSAGIVSDATDGSQSG
jgi:hypothetical protein